MKHHTSKSHHANVLMSGHNPEHHHHKDSHRGTSHETKSTKPCDILMREHRFHGGIASEAPHFSRGGKTSKQHRRFAEGGHVDDEDKEESSREEHKRGGRAKRARHAFGGLTGSAYGGIKRPRSIINDPAMREALNNPSHPMHSQKFTGPLDPSEYNQIKSQYYGKTYKKGGGCYAEGGETKDYGEKPLTGQLRKGGRARHRHSEGETVSEHLKSGGKTKRQHHYWGQSVIGRLPLIGGIANSIANTAGTLDPNKYGGSEYTARTKGQKAADIFSTIGNLGANIALSKGGAKKSKGGGVHEKHRQHHAAGGAGKVRKGMMTESGHMIHMDSEK